MLPLFWGIRRNFVVFVNLKKENCMICMYHSRVGLHCLNRVIYSVLYCGKKGLTNFVLSWTFALYTPANEVWGVYRNHPVCPGLCLSRVNLTLAISFDPKEIGLSYCTYIFRVARLFCWCQNFNLVTLTSTFDLLLRKLNLGHNFCT